MKQNILFILLWMTLFTFTRCTKVVIPLDLAEAILGKWELVELGNWPNMNQISEPPNYREYLTGGLLRVYDYKSGDFYYQNYSIDTLLYEYVRLPNESLLVVTYTCEFFDHTDKLRADYVGIAGVFNTFIFKRID